MSERPLHWSERAKMYQASPGGGRGKPSRPQPPSGKPPRRGPSKGLWIALSVVAVVVAAAATVYFWYLPSRDSDEQTETVSSVLADDGRPEPAEPQSADSEAKDLLNRAMTAMQTGYGQVGSFDLDVLTPDLLAGIDPSITFVPSLTSDDVPAQIARAADSSIDYGGSGLTCRVMTMSDSGNWFSIVADRAEGGGVQYLVNGVERSWDSFEAGVTTTAQPAGATSTPGLYENAQLGCSFEYPADWIDYPNTAEWNSDALLYVGDPQDPLAQTLGIPTDFIAFFGVREPEESPPSPRSIIDELSTGLGLAETASVAVYEPITDFNIKGVPACSVSMLATDSDSTPDMVWTYVALVYEDRGFLFYLVSSLEQLDANQPLFESVVQSFELTDAGP